MIPTTKTTAADPFDTHVPPVPVETEHNLPSGVWRDKAYVAVKQNRWDQAYWYWIYATEACKEEGIRLTYLSLATDALDRWRKTIP